MIRSVLLAVFALLGFSAIDASAAEVRLAYKGVVTSATGAQAPYFVPGQTLSLIYSLDTTAIDINPGPIEGVYYPIGLRHLELNIPGAGVAANYETGVVHTHIEDGGSYIEFESYPTSQGEIAGLPLRWVLVQFLDQSVGPGGSMMLANDALPTSHLVPSLTRATFRTDAGYTTVIFTVEPAESVSSCTSEGYKGTQLTWCKNICENGLTGKVLDTWIHRWVNRYRQLPYCAVDGTSNPS